LIFNLYVVDDVDRTCNSCVAEKLRCAPTEIESRNVAGWRSGAKKERQVVGTIRREGSEMAEVLVKVEEMMEKMEKMAEEITWLKRLVKEGFRKNREEMRQVLDKDLEKRESEAETERSEVEAAMNAMLPDDEEPM
jgi:putative protein kinase ArgK-like GTPase of G3E family